jgi:amino acid permease
VSELDLLEDGNNGSSAKDEETKGPVTNNESSTKGKSAISTKENEEESTDIFDIHRYETHPRNNSIARSIFLMLNTMIGSGILNQPQVFMKAGFVEALLMLTISAVFIWVGLVALVECGSAHAKYDFSELGKFAFGTFGERLVDGCIVVTIFGAIMSYIVVIGGVTSDLWYSWGCASSQPVCSVYFTTALLVFVFVLPTCIIRFLGHLAIYSFYSIFAIVICVVFVIIAGPIKGAS